MSLSNAQPFGFGGLQLSKRRRKHKKVVKCQ